MVWTINPEQSDFLVEAFKLLSLTYSMLNGHTYFPSALVLIQILMSSLEMSWGHTPPPFTLWGQLGITLPFIMLSKNSFSRIGDLFYISICGNLWSFSFSLLKPALWWLLDSLVQFGERIERELTQRMPDRPPQAGSISASPAHSGSEFCWFWDYHLLIHPEVTTF